MTRGRHGKLIEVHRGPICVPAERRNETGIRLHFRRSAPLSSYRMTMHVARLGRHDEMLAASP